ncbi:MAG: ribosome biogenesis GTP-binding protein YihA/YsxC [Candidatus Nomurabacteria bacterium]|nr:ribosome biogenesis GTP-binding protein YihA/YsxC [Candidatus Nomurabacteria bacterium]
MKITSAKFVKGVVGDDEILGNGIPQIAFIGRSNVGKSSVINSLTGVKDLARTSSFPGRTQEINLFLINKKYYFADLPGYGFAQMSKDDRAGLAELINSYFFHSTYEQKIVVLIIDAVVGFTDTDMGMLHALEDAGKDVVIIANKIDKLKTNEFKKQIKKIDDMTVGHIIIPYSAMKKIGIKEVLKELFK